MVANIKVIAKAWEGYRRTVMPADAGPEQVTETRRGFYAGAWALLTTMMALGSDEIDEDQGVDILESVKAEIEAFYRDVNEGRR
jgi:hypothetical protein